MDPFSNTLASQTSQNPPLSQSEQLEEYQEEEGNFLHDILIDKKRFSQIRSTDLSISEGSGFRSSSPFSFKKRSHVLNYGITNRE